MSIKGSCSIHEYINNSKRFFHPKLFTGEGWFFITVLTSITSAQFLSAQEYFPLIFSNYHKIGPRLYSSYLDFYYFTQLSEYDFLKLTKREPFYKIQNITYSRNHEYTLKAAESFQNKKCKLIDFEIYSCLNISTKEILQIIHDDQVLYAKPTLDIDLTTRFSSGFLQTGVDTLEYSDLLLRVPRKLQDLGLDGTDQIISVVDTGVDIQHSFFYDPNNNVQFETINNNHRKIIQYNTKNDQTDINGHGTSVASVISGTPLNNNDANKLYEGVAPGSKLHIIDIIDDETYSTENLDLNNQIELMREVGSTINQNSWQETSSNDLIDIYNAFSFNNSDLLFVFSAGNNKNQQTIYSPSDCKNGLTVGYTNRPGSSSIENDNRQPVLTNGSYTLKVNDLFEGCSVYQTTSPLIDLHNLKISKTDDLNVAYFANDCVNQEVQASLLIYPQFLECTQFGKTPAVYINQDDISSEQLNTIIEEMKTVSINFSFEKNTIQLSTSSSQGPTRAQIKKPDLVAPGENVGTAKIGTTGTNFDSLTKSTGSSIAAAEISGLAAITKQYFTKGYYTTLEENQNNAIQPSSSLLRAVLINSAEPLTENILTYQSGFGIPYLSRSLGFDENIGVRFLDKIEIEPNSHHQYSLKTTKVGTLSITMAYADYIRYYEERLPLYCDLDIVIVAPNNQVYTGNQLDDNRPEEFSNVEKVIIKDAPIGTYTIHIYSSDYDTDDGNINIDYALAIFGGFETNDLTTNPRFLTKANSNTCPNNCNKQGNCVNGICQCNSEHYGHYCQVQITSYPNGALIQSQVEPDFIRWHKIPIQEGGSLELIFRIPSKYRVGNMLTLLLSPTNPKLVDSPYSGSVSAAESAIYTTGLIETTGTTELFLGYFVYGQTSTFVDTTIVLYPIRTPGISPKPTIRRTVARTPSPSPSRSLLPTRTFAPTPSPSPSQSIARTIHIPSHQLTDDNGEAIDDGNADVTVPGADDFQEGKHISSNQVTGIVLGILISMIAIASVFFIILYIIIRKRKLLANAEREQECHVDMDDSDSDSDRFVPNW